MNRLVVLLIVIAPILLPGQSQPKLTVVNAASFQPGMPSGGALATVFIPAEFFAPLTPGLPGIYVPSPPVPLPPTLQGLIVLVNGAVAPILAVAIPDDPTAPVQVNIQVPMERNATLGNINIGTGGAPVPGGTLLVGAAALSPLQNAGQGGFFQDQNGFIAAQHASDHSPVTVQNPARPGEQIIAFADDFFSTWPPPPMGVPVPEQPVYAPFPNLGNVFASRAIEEIVTTYQALYLQEYVGGDCVEGQIVCDYFYTTTPAVPIDAELLAPGMIGVEEIIFHVPANQQPGNWPLFFNTGSCPTGTGAPCPGSPPGSYSSPYATLPVIESESAISGVRRPL